MLTATAALSPLRVGRKKNGPGDEAEPWCEPDEPALEVEPGAEAQRARRDDLLHAAQVDAGRPVPGEDHVVVERVEQLRAEVRAPALPSLMFLARRRSRSQMLA